MAFSALVSGQLVETSAAQISHWCSFLLNQYFPEQDASVEPLMIIYKFQGKKEQGTECFQNTAVVTVPDLVKIC